jgi:hypothetical protein
VRAARSARRCRVSGLKYACSCAAAWPRAGRRGVVRPLRLRRHGATALGASSLILAPARPRDGRRSPAFSARAVPERADRRADARSVRPVRLRRQSGCERACGLHRMRRQTRRRPRALAGATIVAGACAGPGTRPHPRTPPSCRPRPRSFPSAFSCACFPAPSRCCIESSRPALRSGWRAPKPLGPPRRRQRRSPSSVATPPQSEPASVGVGALRVSELSARVLIRRGHSRVLMDAGSVHGGVCAFEPLVTRSDRRVSHATPGSGEGRQG